MQSYAKTIFLMLFFMPVLGGLHSEALAFVPSASDLIKMIVKKMGITQGLSVSQQLSLHNLAGHKKPVIFHESLHYQFPDRFRSEITSAGTKRIHVVKNDDMVTVLDGMRGETDLNRFDLYKDLLLYRSQDLLEARLSVLGIDLNVSSLGRYQQKTMYVIGALYPDQTVSQVWIDREHRLPFRWLIKAGRNPEKTALDVRYLNWFEVDSIWYPRQIAFYQNDTLVRRIDVTHIDVQLAIRPKDFDVDEIRTNYPKPADRLSGDSTSLPKDEIKQIVNAFKMIYQ